MKKETVKKTSLVDIATAPPKEASSALPSIADMPPEALSEIDKAFFDLGQAKQKLAEKEVQKAQADQQKEEAVFKYILLQLYCKYNMNQELDVISMDGKILRNYYSKKEGE
jgi:hypothetical protein